MTIIVATYPEWDTISFDARVTIAGHPQKKSFTVESHYLKGQESIKIRRDQSGFLTPVTVMEIVYQVLEKPYPGTTVEAVGSLDSLTAIFRNESAQHAEREFAARAVFAHRIVDFYNVAFGQKLLGVLQRLFEGYRRGESEIQKIGSQQRNRNRAACDKLRQTTGKCLEEVWTDCGLYLSGMPTNLYMTNICQLGSEVLSIANKLYHDNPDIKQDLVDLQRLVKPFIPV